MELLPAQAEKEWKAGAFRPAYYFIGEEASAKEAALNKLKEILKPDPFNIDEYAGDSGSPISAAVSTALTSPVLSNRRLVVVKNSKLGVEARKTLAEYLREPMETTTLILFSEERKPDPRDILTAAVFGLGGVVVFKPLRAEDAAIRLAEASRKAGKQMEAVVAEFVIDEVGTDWGILKAELEKMLLFTRNREAITQEDALACLGYRRTANPFNLPRALQERELSECMPLLRRLLSEGEEPLRLLYQISSTLNKQLKAKRMKTAGSTDEQIFRDLRLQSYYDRDFMRWAARVSEAKLLAGLHACLQVETQLKSASWLDAGIELERLVAEICGTPAVVRA